MNACILTQSHCSPDLIIINNRYGTTTRRTYSYVLDWDYYYY